MASEAGACAAIAISALIGLIVSCVFFIYHAPGATEIALTEDLGLNSGQVGVLIGVYSIPNFFMPVLAGGWIDRWGLKPVGFCLLAIATLGSAIYALATVLATSSSAIYGIFIAGRVVQGIACESLVTFSQAACNFWFAGPHESKSMGTAFAVQQVLGSAVSFWALEWIREEWSLTTADWAVFIFCLMSCMGFVLLAVVERFYAAYLVRVQKRAVSFYRGLVCFCWGSKSPPVLETELLGCSSAPPPSKVVERSFMVKVRAFSTCFWLENLYIFFVVTILYTSANFFPNLLKKDERYQFSDSDAALCSGTFYLSMIFAPVAGSIVDHFGYRVHFQTAFGLVLLTSLALMYLTSITPWVLVPFMGWCFSWIEQNCYTILGRTFEEMPFDASGLGFGFLGIFLNCGLTVVPPVVGLLGEEHVREQILLYAIFVASGVAISVAVWCADYTGIVNGRTGS